MIVRAIQVTCDSCFEVFSFRGPQRSDFAISMALEHDGWKASASGQIHVCPRCLHEPPQISSDSEGRVPDES